MLTQNCEQLKQLRCIFFCFGRKGGFIHSIDLLLLLCYTCFCIRQIASIHVCQGKPLADVFFYTQLRKGKEKEHGKQKEMAAVAAGCSSG